MFRLLVVLWAALVLGTAVPALAAESQPVKAAQSVVNINTASAAELEILPGIGKVTAGRRLSRCQRALRQCRRPG